MDVNVPTGLRVPPSPRVIIAFRLVKAIKTALRKLSVTKISPPDPFATGWVAVRMEIAVRVTETVSLPIATVNFVDRHAEMTKIAPETNDVSPWDQGKSVVASPYH